MTSGLGARRAPIAGASTRHKGIDYAGALGTPIIAPNDLRVTFAGKQRGYGNVVYGVDGQGNEFRFAHLNSIGVSQGQTIGRGGQLGTLGSTGRSTGNHLHLETRDKSGRLIDPRSLLNKGKSLASNALSKAKDAILLSNPVTAPIAIAGKILGGGKSWIEQIQDWIKNSGFFQRIALAIFAFILLFAAFYLMKSNVITQATNILKRK